MSDSSKGKSILRFNWVLTALLLILTFLNLAANPSKNFHYSSSLNTIDSPPQKIIGTNGFLSRNRIDTPPVKTPIIIDSLLSEKDSTFIIKDTISLKLSADTLEAPV